MLRKLSGARLPHVAKALSEELPVTSWAVTAIERGLCIVRSYFSLLSVASFALCCESHATWFPQEHLEAMAAGVYEDYQNPVTARAVREADGAVPAAISYEDRLSAECAVHKLDPIEKRSVFEFVKKYGGEPTLGVLLKGYFASWLRPKAARAAAAEVIAGKSISAVLHDRRNQVIQKFWPGLAEWQVQKFAEYLKDLKPGCWTMMYLNEEEWFRREELVRFLIDITPSYGPSGIKENGDLQRFVSLQLKEGHDSAISLLRAKFVYGFFRNYEHHGFRKDCPFDFLHLAANLAFDNLQDMQKGLRLAIEQYPQLRAPDDLIMEREHLRKTYYDLMFARLLRADEWIGPDIETDRWFFPSHEEAHRFSLARQFAAHMHNPAQDDKRQIEPFDYWRGYFRDWLRKNWTDPEGGDSMLEDVRVHIIVNMVSQKGGQKDYGNLLWGVLPEDKFITCFAHVFAMMDFPAWNTAYDNLIKNNLIRPLLKEKIARTMLIARTPSLDRAIALVREEMKGAKGNLRTTYPYFPKQVVDDLTITMVLGVTSRTDLTPADYEEQLAKAEAQYCTVGAIWPGLSSDQVSRFKSNPTDLRNPKLQKAMLDEFMMAESEEYRREKPHLARLGASLIDYVSDLLKADYSTHETMQRAFSNWGFLRDSQQWAFVRNGCPADFLFRAANHAYDFSSEVYRRAEEKGSFFCIDSQLCKANGVFRALQEDKKFRPPHPLIGENPALRKLYFEAACRLLMSKDGEFSGLVYKIDNDCLRLQNHVRNEKVICDSFVTEITKIPYKRVKKEDGIKAREVWNNFFSHGLVRDSQGAQTLLSELVVVDYVWHLHRQTSPDPEVPEWFADDFIINFPKVFGFWYQHIWRPDLSASDMLTDAIAGAYGEAVAKHMLKKGSLNFFDAKSDVDEALKSTLLILKEEYPNWPNQTLKDLAISKVLGVTSCNDPKPANYKQRLAHLVAYYAPQAGNNQ